MAEASEAKSKLQLDDPSIIQCVDGNVAEKQRGVKKNQSSTNGNRNRSPATNDKKKLSKPKLVPARQQQKREHKDATPSGSFQLNEGRRPNFYRNESPKQSASGKFYSSNLSPNYHQKKHSTPQSYKRGGGYGGSPVNQTRASKSNERLEKQGSVPESTPPRRTGTLIDSLVQDKLAPNFNSKTVKQKTDKSKPDVIQNLLSKDQPKNKTSSKLQETKPTTPKSTSNIYGNSIESVYRGKIAASVSKTESTVKDSPTTSNSASSTEEMNPNKRKRNKKKAKSPKGEVVGSTTVVLPHKAISDNHTVNGAGKEILNMVNGNSKVKAVSNSRPAKSSPKLKEKKEKEKAVKEILETKILPAPREIKPNDTKPEKNSEDSPSANVSTITSSEAAELEKLGLKQAGERLKKDYIVFLEKKKANFPNAKFFCELCNYHLDTVPLAHRHIKEKRHRKLLKDRQQDDLLRQLSIPSPEAMEAIQRLLVDTVLTDSILDRGDIEQRKSAVKRLDAIISKELPKSKIVLYGSSLTGLGFKTSDVNVDLQYPSDMRAPTALLRVLDILERSDAYSDVNADFRAKVPRIDFVDVETSLEIRLSTGNEFAIFTTRLLQFYAALDSRVAQLSMIFRKWAHMCKLDLQHEGSLPPHSLVLMTIFFMQTQKYLPVLHEIVSEEDLHKILKDSMICSKLVWKGKSLMYVPSSTPDVTAVNKNDVTISDESETDSDLDLSVVSAMDLSESPDVGVQIADSSDSTSETISPTEESQKLENVPMKPINLCGLCKGADITIAHLWLQFLRFYALEYPIEDQIISIKTSTRLKREDKNWSKKRIAVVDPYSSKRNLCRSLNTQGVFAYMMSRLKAAVIYFFKAPAKAVKLPNHKLAKSQKSSATQDDLAEKLEPKSPNRDPVTVPTADLTSKFAEQLSNAVITKVLALLKEREDKLSSQLDNDESESPTRSRAIKVADNLLNEILDGLMKLKLGESQETPDNVAVLHVAAEKLSKQVTSDALHEICAILNQKKCHNSVEENPIELPCSAREQLDLGEHPVNNDTNRNVYEFSVSVITGGKYPVSVCGLCKREGHMKRSCPDEVETHTLVPLPPLTHALRASLDRVCGAMYDFYVPTPLEIKQRDGICNALMLYLQREYNPATVMNLFGSSRNGFGFRGSDLDICMTFRGDKDGEGLDFARIIEEVAKHLRRNSQLWNILPITTAKVPIVKFEHRISRLEGDISLYNLLAQRNTSMLSCYAAIDRRCKVLGYAIKAFVKLCHIGDASRGSLSSYAYTLMVIFYLQQKDVPVLPVLQELHSGSSRPEHIVDGWNSWFYSDIRSLHKVWGDYGKNKETVGQLWIGMLRYYTEDFDFRKHVVGIRQKKLLTTFEKEWTSKFISIEDPFDLNHNLGAGVSHKMTNFILRVLIKAREHFGVMPNVGVQNEIYYFFDPEVLMDGEEAPNDRCCRICGKIGHFIRDCPKNKRVRKRQESQTKDGSNGGDSNDFRCFLCGELGHIKRDCPEAKPQSEPNQHRIAHTSKRFTKMENSPKTAKTSNAHRVNSGSPHARGQQEARSVENPRVPNHQSPAKPVQRPTSSEKQSSPLPKTQRAIIAQQGTPPNSDVKHLINKMASSAQTPTKPKNLETKVENGKKLNLTPSSGTSSSSAEESSDANAQVKPNPMNSSAPASNPQWSPLGNHLVRPLTMSIPIPQWSNQAMFRGPAPNLPPSPMNMMTLGQIESQMMHEAPMQGLTSPRSYPMSAQVRKQQQDQKYQEQCNLFRGVPSPTSPVSVVPAAPILGMGVTLPGAPGPNMSPPGLQRPFPFVGQAMTSPLRHPPTSPFGVGPIGQPNGWNSYVQRNNT